MLVLYALLRVVAVPVLMSGKEEELQKERLTCQTCSDPSGASRKSFRRSPPHMCCLKRHPEHISKFPLDINQVRTSITRHAALGHSITILILLSSLRALIAVVSSSEGVFHVTARQSHALVEARNFPRHEEIHGKGRAIAAA